MEHGDGSLTYVDLMGKVVKSEPGAVVNDANVGCVKNVLSCFLFLYGLYITIWLSGHGTRSMELYTDIPVSEVNFPAFVYSSVS